MTSPPTFPGYALDAASEPMLQAAEDGVILPPEHDGMLCWNGMPENERVRWSRLTRSAVLAEAWHIDRQHDLRWMGLVGRLLLGGVDVERSDTLRHALTTLCSDPWAEPLLRFAIQGRKQGVRFVWAGRPREAEVPGVLNVSTYSHADQENFLRHIGPNDKHVLSQR